MYTLPAVGASLRFFETSPESNDYTDADEVTPETLEYIRKSFPAEIKIEKNETRE